MHLRWTHLVGIAFLGLQAGSIVWARLVPERFFSWAPHDQHTRYQIEVEVAGRPLTPHEVGQRYRYRPAGWESKAIANVFAIVRRYESTYGASENARVRIHYSTNGRPEAVWEWPDA